MKKILTFALMAMTAVSASAAKNINIFFIA